MEAQRVLSLLENQTIFLEEEQMIVQLTDPSTNDATFKEGMGIAGYTQALRQINGKYQLKLGKIYWNGGRLIYTSDELLFEDCDTSNAVPENLLYFDHVQGKLVAFDSNIPLYNKLKLFIGLRKLLTDLADHVVPNETVIFLIKNDDGGVKHEVAITLDYANFSKTFEEDVNLGESVRLLEKLQQKISLDDEQDKERRNCMRSAFDVMIQTLEKTSDIFPYCLRNIVKLHSTYNEHHSMFLSDFTINKVIQEINTKDLEYTGKINDITSSVQTKALAIPGAMVAISAIMKVQSLTSAVGVIIALFLTCLVIQKSLDIYAASFTHLSKQINNVFSRYQVLSQKSEVRKEAKNTEEALGTLINKGESGLKYVSKIIWGVWLLSIFFVLMQVCDKDGDRFTLIPSLEIEQQENSQVKTSGSLLVKSENALKPLESTNSASNKH